MQLFFCAVGIIAQSKCNLLSNYRVELTFFV